MAYHAYMEVEWDLKDNGEYAKLLVGYEYDMKDDSLTVFSVMQDGLEWVDYLNTATRQYLCKYINERIEK
jgi:hypothetical protein